MPRRAKTNPATVKVGRAVTRVATIGRRLDDRVQPWATAVGWVGVAALVVCGVFAVLPESDRPQGLSHERLAFWAMLSLVTASLLGWAFMQEGQARIERRAGRRGALVLFVFLPIAAAIVTFCEEHAPLGEETRVSWAGFFWAARWYSPGAIVACLGSFLASKSRRGRGTWYALLLLPYVLLVAVLVFGFRLPWIDAPLRRTLGGLGHGAVALQIVLAWFVGTAA
jgi:quinol-cytochrome oxidoreductase complex cytochrome b subunit